jgi:hypothetical protein
MVQYLLSKPPSRLNKPWFEGRRNSASEAIFGFKRLLRGLGRGPWDPMLMFKMVFLQLLYDGSDRDIEEQCTRKMQFGRNRYFYL